MIRVLHLTKDIFTYFTSIMVRASRGTQYYPQIVENPSHDLHEAELMETAWLRGSFGMAPRWHANHLGHEGFRNDKFNDEAHTLFCVFIFSILR